MTNDEKFKSIRDNMFNPEFSSGFVDGYDSMADHEHPNTEKYREGFSLGLSVSPLLQTKEAKK